MKKVLIIEDEEYRHVEWREAMGGRVELISALSIEQAMERFTANPDLVAIAVDACVPGDEPTTLPLVREFRKTFSGPMIAISSISDYRLELIQAGCNHQCRKDELPEELMRVLGLN